MYSADLQLMSPPVELSLMSRRILWELRQKIGADWEREQSTKFRLPLIVSPYYIEP